MAFQKSLALEPYDQIVERVSEALENDLPPWQMPWSDKSQVKGMPLRHNGVPYQGLNVLALITVAHEKGYEYPYWMTFPQAREYGGKVRNGERASKIRYYKTIQAEAATTKAENTKTEDKKTEKTGYVARWSNVFNVHQIDGLPSHFYSVPNWARELGTEKDPKLEQFFAATDAKIEVDNLRGAAYSPPLDKIFMPEVERFLDAGKYYATLSHEMIHWTGHPERCNREFSQNMKKYAEEEMIAEFGNCMLCFQLGLQPDYEQSAAYIANYRKEAKKDKNIIGRTAAAANQAANHVIAYAPELAREIAAENALVGTLPKAARSKAAIKAVEENESKEATNEKAEAKVTEPRGAEVKSPEEEKTKEKPVAKTKEGKAPALPLAPFNDERYRSFALSAAVAISQRIGASNAVHGQDTLIGDLAMLAHTAERAEGNMPNVDSTAQQLATYRATFNAKLIVAKNAVEKDPRGERFQTLKKDIFVAAVSGRREGHPLQFSHHSVRVWYDNSVDEVVEHALEKCAEPTPTERLAAKVIVFEKTRSLVGPTIAPALTEVFKSGDLTPADKLQAERDTLMSTLPYIKEPPAKTAAEEMLTRVFSAFTHKEITDMATSSTPATVNGSALAPGLKNITEAAGAGKSTAAWYAAAKKLEEMLHPARQQEKGQLTFEFY
ncbi:MAG: zincin-like metallopeptidase domain-containing protein [Aestuariivita sp.]|nr:zincin-like metallopeptidase domain-containing protein [Aestuariivita sp.]MCY4345380.1 zincin-like metallopeptidase domain-containing protein [Aestuariivita sp.]